MRQDDAERQQQLNAFMGSALGLAMDAAQQQAAWTAAQQLMAAGGHASLDAYLAALRMSSSAFQQLLRHVTVAETYFFRDPPQLDALHKEILPALIADKAQTRSLSIVSAGCATGEEPYSVAILLAELLPGLSGWHIEITGVDVNAASLATARTGVYAAWSLRSTQPWMAQKYFIAEGRNYRLRDPIRGMVRFQQLNLAAEFPFHQIDLVICRNVFIYFSRAAVVAALGGIHAALRPGGWLMLGAIESSSSDLSRFQAHRAGDAVVYRKLAVTAAGAVSAPAELPPPEVQPATPAPPPPAAALPPAARTAPSSTPAAHYQRALAAANSGKYDVARGHCEALLAQVPDSRDGYYLLAILEGAEGRHAAAMERLKRAVFLDARFVMGHWRLGLLHRELGNRAESQRHLMLVTRLLAPVPRDHIIEESNGETAGRVLSAARLLLERRDG